jgi:hypothetical protein
MGADEVAELLLGTLLDQPYPSADALLAAFCATRDRHPCVPLAPFLLFFTGDTAAEARLRTGSLARTLTLNCQRRATTATPAFASAPVAATTTALTTATAGPPPVHPAWAIGTYDTSGRWVRFPGDHPVVSAPTPAKLQSKRGPVSFTVVVGPGDASITCHLKVAAHLSGVHLDFLACSSVMRQWAIDRFTTAALPSGDAARSLACGRPVLAAFLAQGAPPVHSDTGSLCRALTNIVTTAAAMFGPTAEYTQSLLALRIAVECALDTNANRVPPSVPTARPAGQLLLAHASGTKRDGKTFDLFTQDRPDLDGAKTAHPHTGLDVHWCRNAAFGVCPNTAAVCPRAHGTLPAPPSA